MSTNDFENKSDKEILEWVDFLISDKRREDLMIDYKYTINLKDVKDKREVSKDVTAFANTAGGTLIIGVEEKKLPNGDSVPSGKYGIEQLPNLETRIKQILEDTVAPRIPHIIFREIKVPNGYIYVIHCPKSWMRPHMVSGYDEKRYYKRADDRNIPMEAWEIEEFVKEREKSTHSKEKYLKTIRDGSELIKKSTNHLTFKFIIIPLPINENMIDLFGPSGRPFWQGETFMFGNAGHKNWRPCEDGIVLHKHGGKSHESPYIVKIHPTGALSYTVQDVDNFLYNQDSFFLPVIFNMAFPKELRDFLLDKYLKKLTHRENFLIQITAVKLPAKLNAGVEPRARVEGGLLIEHPEYLQSDSITITATTTQKELDENLQQVIDALLDDMGRKIGIWNYAYELKQTPHGKSWYDNF